MDPVAAKFQSFTISLLEATNYDEIIAVCRAIDSIDPLMFENHRKADTYQTLNPHATNLTKALANVFQTSKDLSIHLKIMKCIMKPALCLNYFYVDQILNWYEIGFSKLGAEVLRSYAWLQNIRHLEAVNVAFPNNLEIQDSFEDGSIKYSKHTRYFALSIENMITAYDAGIVKTNQRFWFVIILTNLENSHENVHKLLIELYKRMVRCYKESENAQIQLIEKVIDLPWTSRSKYPLLANIIQVNEELLIKNSKFDLSNFIEGLKVGLTLHHLLAPSQTLVKVLRGKEYFKKPLFDAMAYVMWHCDIKLASNLVKFWFTTLKGKEVEKLFEIMSRNGKFKNVPTTSEKFYRLLLLRNAFKKSFKVPDIDLRIRKFACEIDDLPTKIEIFHILIDNVHSENERTQRIENVLTTLKFIRSNIAMEDSSFIDQHIIRKMPDFFNLLASKKMREISVLREVFNIVRDDIYQQGFEINSYESIMFSLKFLNVILKQYCGSSGNRLSRSTNIEGNLTFGKYLKDHHIWDLTSQAIFMQLLRLLDQNDNGDISEMAMRLLIEYFVKKSIAETFILDEIPFIQWIEHKIFTIFNDPFIPACSGADRHFILKFEYSMKCSLDTVELQAMSEALKENFIGLKNEDNLVDSMEKGLHLFRIIDSASYALKRMEPSRICHQSISVISVLLKLITSYFLNFMSREGYPPSFEILDQNLTTLISRHSNPHAEPHVLKPKLILFIWYTLRATSEATESIASIVRANLKPNHKDFLKTMQTCIDINVQILYRCCHKGVIDSASQAIGRIAKIVSDERARFCVESSEGAKNLNILLDSLKNEIDCGKRPSGDIRSARGLIVLAHKIINSHPPFLQPFVDIILIAMETPKRFEDNLLTQFFDTTKPIQLHLLAALIRDGDLVEYMLKFYDSILLATFKAYKEPNNDFVVENALLQIIGAIIPKLANQKRHLMGEEESTAIRYEPKAVTAYEFYVKTTYAFRVALYDLTHLSETMPKSYKIVLLEIFSNFEYRFPGEHWNEIELLRGIFRDLMMKNECEKVRRLAAKCYSQWHDNNDAMLKIIKDDVANLFVPNGNIVSSTAHCLTLMIQRYESNVKFVTSFNTNEFKSLLRQEITRLFETEKFVGAINFYIRYHLLDFLMFLGFTFDHEVVQSLTNETGLQSHFGYQMWSEKLKQIMKK